MKTERIGHYNPSKGRPISIKFAFKSDADWLLSSRKNLNRGIFVDKQYSDKTEYELKCLRPILSDLVIRGKKYNWNNLEELPQNLSTHTVLADKMAHTLGFLVN